MPGPKYVLGIPSLTDVPAGVTNRAFDTAYQPSPLRPSFLFVQTKIVVNMGDSADLKLQISSDGTVWDTVGERQLATAGLLSVVLGATQTIAITDIYTFFIPLPPGAWWKLAKTTSGSPTVQLVNTREVVM